MRIKETMLIIAGLTMLTSCGDSGSSTPQPSLTAVGTSRIGTYKLTSYTNDMTNTGTNIRQVVTSTPNDTQPFTGTLKIGVTSWTKTLDPGDGSGSMNQEGTYLFSRYLGTTSGNDGGYLDGAPDTSGFFRIANRSNSASKEGRYSVSNPKDLQLEYDLEMLTVGSGTYRVITTEKWTKTSDTL